MITLDNLHKAPALLRNPVYRQYMEILSGRRKGKCHSAAIVKKLQAHGLVDSKRKVTILGISALDSK